uniref:Potassium channel domain-containing protein n=1 Tax=Plectus sambesii TaxID=2011161 RepID=A0A914V5F1_9BILA
MSKKNDKIVSKPAHKRVLRFLFSKFGLVLLLGAYCSGGAFLFGAIEYEQYETAVQGVNKTKQILELKNNLPRLIIEAIANYSGPNDTSCYVGYARVKKLIDNYHFEVADAIEKYEYTGVLIDNGDTIPNKWNFFSGLLFCFTTITLIGYGHVVPVTQFGRAMVLPYALLGIPLTLMFLANIGTSFANLLRTIYHHLCCFPFNRKRKQVQDRYSMDDLKMANTPKPSIATLKTGPVADIQMISILPEEIDNVPSLIILLVMVAYLAIGAGIFSLIEKWSFTSSYYYCFVTLVTIGFGDMVPGLEHIHEAIGKISIVIAVLYTLLGLGILGMGINIIVAQFIFKYRSIGRKMGVVEAVDEDGDGVDDGDEMALRGMKTLGRAF